MSREGLPNSYTYTYTYTSTVTTSSPMAGVSAEGAMVFGHQCIKFQNQVPSVTREALGIGSKR